MLMNEEELRLLMDKQEAPIYLVCEECGAEIYLGNEYFITEDGQTLCEDCMDKYLEEQKNTARQVAGEE